MSTLHLVVCLAHKFLSEGQAVLPGESATFEVAVSGTAPFIYRWFLNGRFLVGETSPTLTISDMSYEQVGTVKVEVTNDIACVSKTSTLDLALPPEFLAEPEDRSIVRGENARFLFEARGQRPITYEVTKLEGEDIGANASISGLIQFDQFQENGGRYRLTATNATGSASVDFQINVRDLPETQTFSGKKFRYLSNPLAPSSETPQQAPPAGTALFLDPSANVFYFQNTREVGPIFALTLDGNSSQVEVPEPLVDYQRLNLLGYSERQGLVLSAQEEILSEPFKYEEIWALKNGTATLLFGADDLATLMGEGVRYSFSNTSQVNDEFILRVRHSITTEGSYRDDLISIGDPPRIISPAIGTFMGLDGETRTVESSSQYLGTDASMRPCFFLPSQGNDGEDLFIRIEQGKIMDEFTLPCDRIPSTSTPFFSGISTIYGLRYFYCEDRLLEITEEGLIEIDLSVTLQGNRIHHPQFPTALASESRLFFIAQLADGNPSSADIINIRGSDSIYPVILALDSEGVSTVLERPYFNRRKINTSRLAIRAAIGDQAILSGGLIPNPDDPNISGRDFLILNQAGERATLKIRHQNNGMFLEVPLGKRLTESTTLNGSWNESTSKAGQFSILPKERAKFFRLE